MTLTEFWLARIAEDEAVAKAATPGPWEARHGGEYSWVALYVDETTIPEDESLPSMEPGGSASRADATHIARHDPARVLADCEAKRRIVELHSGEAVHGCPSAPDDTTWREGPCPTLRALALPYADHPDYREEWKP